MKKIILTTIILVAAVIIGYFIYAIILSVSSQKMPVLEITRELKKLEKNIQNETNSGISTFFTPIKKYEIKNCNGKLSLDVYINKDSIIKSKSLLDTYIFSVNKRVNQQLMNKECIDSLIVNVSLSINDNNNLKQNKYRYSFPLEK